MSKDDKSRFKSFPGSAFLEKLACGRIDTTDPSEYEDVNAIQRLLKKADIMCIKKDGILEEEGEDYINPRNVDPSSSLFAKALVNEVTDNPKTMTPSAMAEREKQLIKAQRKANSNKTAKKVGADGKPAYLNSLTYAITGDETPVNMCAHPNEIAHTMTEDYDEAASKNPFSVIIGLAMSQRSKLGHPETVTRQTAFDFNQLQDREYQFVSNTDSCGWRAGGGEHGGTQKGAAPMNRGAESPKQETLPSLDTSHIPIIRIDCNDQDEVDQVVHALASGEIFIPHMQILPESLGVNTGNPPNLIVKFGCERSDETEPDEWANWCLEFMHNQLYDYFEPIGAKWNKRPFHMTLARKVRWKTVKHMNKYFAQCEQVIEGWRMDGPQYLEAKLTYKEGGSMPPEVSHPHGIYLFRSGVATNYFPPNFAPPYTTKMTRSLLLNVLNKSWDRKRLEWSSDPVPRLVTPGQLFAAACGCSDADAGGYLATEATRVLTNEASNKNEMQLEPHQESPAPEDSKSPPTKQRYDPAPSEFGHSVAMSGTTVMHANKSRDGDWDVSAESKFQTLVDERKKKEALIAKLNKTSSPRKKDDPSTMSLEYSADGSSTLFQEYKGKQNSTDMLSLQASATTESVQSYVPTDEELFEIGWAKALDPQSGHYYYFTLDRTKTVWESPLESHIGIDAPGA